jgi:hypothetical protein
MVNTTPYSCAALAQAIIVPLEGALHLLQEKQNSAAGGAGGT